MRNIAYCQWTGCGGGFQINRAESCSLRRRIMRSGFRTIDGNDELHFANCVKAGL
jgi:hypothetical protein